MPCYEKLSAFDKPLKFGSRPCYQSRLNYETKMVEVVELTSPADYIQASDCPYPIDLIWLNQKGGYDWFTFTFRHSYGLSTSGAKTFVDESNTEYYAHRGTVRSKVTIQSQHLSKSTVESLRSLLKAIQVWEKRGNTHYPVLIAESDYTIRQEGQGLIQLSFEMVYGQMEIIQTA